jgi:hypothetical protein
MNNKFSQKSPLRLMNQKQKNNYMTRKTNNIHQNLNQHHNNQMQTQNNQKNNYTNMQNNNNNHNRLIKLTETVYDVFSKNYINYTPTYQEIYQIIKKDPPLNINSNSVLRLITSVRQYYEKKLENMTPKIETLNTNENEEVKPSNAPVIDNEYKLNKTNLSPSNIYLDNNQNPIALPPPIDGGFQLPYKPEEIMNTNMDIVDTYIVIDSKDRDTTRFEAPNGYTIDLSPNSFTSNNERKGYIKRGFSNVVSVELISCLIINSSSLDDASDNSSPPPYVVLEIPELSRHIYGTNDTLSNGFDILTTYLTQGQYKYFNLPLNSGISTLIHKYEPRITLNKLTINFRLPNGDLYDFGSDNNNNTNTINQIVLKVRQMKHKISTTFLHKENS